MEYKLVYSPEALEDLDRIWMEVWDASQDLDITEKYVAGIRSSVREKCRRPKTGTPLTFMGEFMGVYYVRFKEYIAFYRIQNSALQVWRVLYARSDYMKTLYGRSEYTFEDTDDL